MKREFKDLVIYEPYDYLNSEITGDYDKIEWKPYSVDDQNVMVIAGPGDIRMEKGLLAEQYKAVLPLLKYYQFMDKFFTPGYLADILAAREQGSQLRW